MISMRILGYDSKIGCFGPTILLPKSDSECLSDVPILEQLSAVDNFVVVPMAIFNEFVSLFSLEF